MGFDVIKISESQLPFTYQKGRVVDFGDIDTKIYCKDNPSRYGGEGGFHPARCISVLLGLLHNKDVSQLEYYSKILLDESLLNYGEILFQYKFYYLLHENRKNVMRPNWVSGFAQGMGLLFFTRYYNSNLNLLHQLSERKNIITSIRNGLTNNRIMQNCDNGTIFFNEYEGQCDALNGHIYALYGLYEHWYWTANENSLWLLKCGMQWVINNFEKYRNPNTASFYCTSHKVVCDKAGGKYHSVHINQLLWLYNITVCETFKTYADILLSDFKPTRKTGSELNLLFP